MSAGTQPLSWIGGQRTKGRLLIVDTFRLASVAPPRKRFATALPPRRDPATTPALRALSVLRDQFDMQRLTSLPDFLLVVEGETDRSYMQRAADQLRVETGEDLLDVPQPLRKGMDTRVAIVVAKVPGDPKSGGTERMVQLAREIREEIFTHECARILFLFDHDHAGRSAAAQIAQYGYRSGTHSLTLHPAFHKEACVVADESDPSVVIEDLLPLTLQRRFFDEGRASCDVICRGGVVRRYRWIAPSKGELRRFVVQHASTADLASLREILARMRNAFGFPPSVPADPGGGHSK